MSPLWGLFNGGAVSESSIRRWLSGAIVMTVLISAAGYAADGVGVCGTIRLGETTVATLQNSPIVTLFANGAAVTLLLDTGAQTTVLTPAAAQRIGAQRPRIEFERQMRGIAGSLQTGEVELRSFSIGGVAIPWRRVRVGQLGVANAFEVPIDGVLGVDTLSSFDIDLDLPGYRMVLYQRQTCAGAAPAWAEPYDKIAASRSLDDHLFFRVQLDGRSVAAFIDTGAQLTVLSTQAAAALGLTGAVLARDRAILVHGAAAEELNAHVHRFARLGIGTEVIRNLDIAVTDLRLGDADLVLGVDFLKSRRMWMSYGSQRIFLSRRI
jgi:clan AA aspartic protease (TIGR02281 family)